MPLYDFHTLLLVFLMALAGGVIGLDRTALGQFMISQPVVCGPLVGWLLGDLRAGIVIGAVLELIWVLDMPVGTFVPADSTVTTVSATAIAAIGSAGKAGLDVIGLCLLLTTAMVPVTMTADEFMRKRNSLLADAAVSAARESSDGGLSRAHLAGLGAFFLKSFVLYLLFIPAGLMAVSSFAHLPEKAHQAMALFVKVLPMLGAAMILRKLSIAALDRSFAIGFATALVLSWLFHGYPVAVLLFVIGTGFVAARHWGRV